MSKMRHHNVVVRQGDLYGGTGEDLVKIAEVFPASPEAALAVLAAPEAADHGRSQWVWVRLANGDLVLGVYPQGSTYESLEGPVEEDHRRSFGASPAPGLDTLRERVVTDLPQGKRCAWCHNATTRHELETRQDEDGTLYGVERVLCGRCASERADRYEAMGREQ